MYLLPENSRRRENVIAGLSAALVGLAMLVMAGKASATYAEPAGHHAHAPAEVDRAEDEEPSSGDVDAKAAPHAGHEGHAGHEPAEVRQDDHDQHPASPEPRR